MQIYYHYGDSNLKAILLTSGVVIPVVVTI